MIHKAWNSKYHYFRKEINLYLNKEQIFIQTFFNISGCALVLKKWRIYKKIINIKFLFFLFFIVST